MIMGWCIGIGGTWLSRLVGGGGGFCVYIMDRLQNGMDALISDILSSLPFPWLTLIVFVLD